LARRSGPLLHAKFHPYRCKDKGIGPSKLKFLLIFDQNVEHKRPVGAYPLHDLYKICRICTPFKDALAIKVLLDLLKGLWSYGGFNLMGSGNPQIFSAPGGETMRQTTKRFRGARTCSRSSITTPSLVWLGFHPPPGWRKHIEFFVYPLRFFVRHALSLCYAYKHQSLFARFRHENVGEQK